MKCGFINSRVEFFTVLNEKLGPEFSLQPVTLGETESLFGCEVIIFALPPQNPSEAKQMSTNAGFKRQLEML